MNPVVDLDEDADIPRLLNLPETREDTNDTLHRDAALFTAQVQEAVQTTAELLNTARQTEIPLDPPSEIIIIDQSGPDSVVQTDNVVIIPPEPRISALYQFFEQE